MKAQLKFVKPVLGLSSDRLPALAASLLVAELLFKFRSFTLECLAFLALWRLLDFLVSPGQARSTDHDVAPGNPPAPQT